MRERLRQAMAILLRPGFWWDSLYLTAGALLLVLSIDIFLAPGGIAPGGVSGTSIIINHVTGWPVGLMMFALNLPLLVLGFRHLGAFSFLSRTLFVVLLWNLGIDIFARWLPADGLTGDVLLNALYGGVIGGVGTGLVYRGAGSIGGTDILARIMQRRSGVPVSQLYILTDGLVVLAAALVLGWDKALYALISIFVWGLAADFTLEGPSVVRTVFIITDNPQQVAQAVLDEMQLGLTAWHGQGMYTGDERSVLFCTLNRSEVSALRQAVSRADPTAFLVVGQGHQAMGGVVRRKQHQGTKIPPRERAAPKASPPPHGGAKEPK